MKRLIARLPAQKDSAIENASAGEVRFIGHKRCNNQDKNNKQEAIT